MHGYEIAQVVQGDEALRAIWRIERSEIYFLLGKLSKGGLIMESAAEQAGGPVRVIYAPTEAGRAQFHQWLRTPEAKPRNLRTALLARLHGSPPRSGRRRRADRRAKTGSGRMAGA